MQCHWPALVVRLVVAAFALTRSRDCEMPGLATRPQRPSMRTVASVSVSKLCPSLAGREREFFRDKSTTKESQTRAKSTNEGARSLVVEAIGNSPLSSPQSLAYYASRSSTIEPPSQRGRLAYKFSCTRETNSSSAACYLLTASVLMELLVCRLHATFRRQDNDLLRVTFCTLRNTSQGLAVAASICELLSLLRSVADSLENGAKVWPQWWLIIDKHQK